MDAFFSSSLLSPFPTQNILVSSSPAIATAIPKLRIISCVRLRSKPTTKKTPQTQINPSTFTAATKQTGSVLLAAVFNAVDDFIDKFIDPPRRASVDPRHVLSHNFAPVVDELPPTECEIIQGSLPLCLDGAYIRNGPNPQFVPSGPFHLFDGDGMVHSVRISRGRAVLCSRYVQTYKYRVERDAGRRLIPSIFSSFNGLTALATRGAVFLARVITGGYNPLNGIGAANTSLAFFGDRLYALGEPDLPYSLRLTSDGDIQTLGRHDFNGKLSISMTAHPKIDPETGEAFAFRYSPILPPFLTYFRFDSNGTKQPDLPISSMPTPSFLHDFAITKKYAIFADIQLGVNPIDVVTRGASSFVSLDPSKVSRIGVIPRYSEDESEMRWFDVPGLNIMHVTNAWDDDEDDDVIVVLAPNILSAEHIIEKMELVQPSFEKIKIDLKTGIVTRQTISSTNIEFAVINSDYVARKNKYVYAAVVDPMPNITGVVKLDVSNVEHMECIVASRMFGHGCYGSEPFFVAKEPENPAAEEDDGYLVLFVHDEKAGESRFLVMDAKSPQLDIVAALRLPRRVPSGFHGLFVKESDLNKL